MVKNRIISVRLREGKDDDLIQWWNSEIDKSYLVRKFIRAGLNGTSGEYRKQELTASCIVPLNSAPTEMKEIFVEQEEDFKDLMSQFDD